MLLPELKLSDDGKLYNQLKDWTGQNAGRIQINGKYAGTYSIEPSANFIAFTNHLNAVKGMEEDDRRVSTYLSPAVPKDRAWYAAAAPVLHSVAEVERVYSFLMARNLTQFNPHTIPDAALASKRLMMIDNLSDAASWVHGLCAGSGKLARRKFLTIREIEELAAVEAPASLRGKVSSKMIRAGLKAAGCKPHGQVMAGRNRASIWFGPGMTLEQRKSAKMKKSADLFNLAADERKVWADAQIASAFGTSPP